MEDSIQVSTETIRVPTANSRTLTLEMGEIRRLEARKEETAFVSKQKAPELLRALEQGYSLVVTKLLPNVNYEVAVAQQAVEARRAVVMLDEAPRILAEKRLTKASSPCGTADQRENILALDKEYQGLQDILARLKAVQELLKGKARGFEMSFQATKRVFDARDTYGDSSRSIPSLPDDATAGDEIVSVGNGGFRVGKPRY